MEYSDSDAAKWLRRLQLNIDDDGWEDSFGIALARLAGIELPREEFQFLSGPILEAEYSKKPHWVRDLALAERFEIVAGKRPLIVGPAEITATLWSQLTDTTERPAAVTEVLLWAAAATQARHTGGGGIWHSLDRQIADADVIQEGGRLWEVYSDLANRIRRKVVRVVQEAEASEKERARRTQEWESKRQDRQREAVKPRGGMQVPLRFDA